MTKQAKELITVLLVGAGALFILWGVTYTRQPVGGYGSAVSETNWTAVGIGLGVVVMAAVILFLGRTKKA